MNYNKEYYVDMCRQLKIDVEQSLRDRLTERTALTKILKIVQGDSVTGPCTHPDSILIAAVANEALGEGPETELYTADKPSHRRRGLTDDYQNIRDYPGQCCRCLEPVLEGIHCPSCTKERERLDSLRAQRVREKRIYDFIKEEAE